MMPDHELINPSGLPQPIGFSHVVAAAPGRAVFVAGQVGSDAEGRIASAEIEEQFDQAAANVVEALTAAGAEPRHVVSLQIFTTDVEGYRERSREIGAAYRRHFGRHYPAMALLGVTRLFDERAKVELVAIAVVPEAAA
jgi:enamine deaminase RidA (YjgF/YER057c/UK114 family)